MNIKCVCLIIVLLCFNNIVKTLNLNELNMRDTFISFMKAATLHEYSLPNEQCFGENFENDINKLVSLYNNNDYANILLILQKLFYDVSWYCYSNEVGMLYKKFLMKKQEKTLYDRHTSKLISITKIIVDEIKNKESNSNSIGTALGKVVFILTKNGRKF